MVVSTAKITVKGPAHTAGTVTVTVTTAGGTSGAKHYTYANAPTITSITPTAGRLVGGTTVTVTGTGFTSGATVAFGTGHPGTTVMVVSTAQDHRQGPSPHGRDGDSGRNHGRRDLGSQALRL